MHGRVKVRTSEEEQAAKEKERQTKLQLYQQAMTKIRSKRDDGELDEEMLTVTSQLLAANPDIYTLWNIRRETLNKFMEKKDSDAIQELLSPELALVEQALRANPKSYGAWNHRVWVLSAMPAPSWERELRLANKALQLDERNFHCWDFRRWVANRGQVPHDEELSFSGEKIADNFSNYSAWHYRSSLLPIVHPDQFEKGKISETAFTQELELVQSAAFTDPNDQSAWLYLRWVLGLRNPVKSPKISHLHFSRYGDDSLCISVITNQAIKSNHLRLTINEEENNVQWQSVADPGAVLSCLWVCHKKHCTLTDSITVAVDLSVTECDPAVCAAAVRAVAGSFPTGTDGAYSSQQLVEGDKKCVAGLDDELQSCLELLELEPEAKWPLLTSVHLMRIIDSAKYHDQILNSIEILERVDSLRSSYYHDLRSEVMLERSVHNMDSTLSLTNARLSKVSHPHFLATLRKVDFSFNELCSTLSWIPYLRQCNVLILDNNEISSLEGISHCVALEQLSLKNNSLRDENDLAELGMLLRLKTVYLEGNPLCSKNEWKNNVMQIVAKGVTVN